MSQNSSEQTSNYQVLARKHRPSTFSDLIGQEVMVKILENSFLANRIAHAFMLTGVRGVGKTTTARIIAKGLNCVGSDGLGFPTILPCGKCQNCLAITNGNHVDVMEFDAASRTGVSDIREIIDGVYYRAASARFKVYIIDEVHMLSTSAFNALLKTLEEPPKHVKFIFATTEIKKVPSTVLSRCQRFDLRRIEPQAMVTYLKSISDEESCHINEECLAQVARASEGSMRDALSLLEQILVDTDGEVTVKKVRLILGLADRGRLLDLFFNLVSGNVVKLLEEYNDLYKDGADPISLLKELCEITHWITVLKVAPNLHNDLTMSPDERSRGKELSKQLGVGELARVWQLLVKILDESSVAINSKMSVEMGLIRAAYVSNLPTPDKLIKTLTQSERIDENATYSERKALEANFHKSSRVNPSEPSITQIGALKQKSDKHTNIRAAEQILPSTFDSVIELIKTSKDLELLIEIENNFRLVNYQIGRIEFEPTVNAAKNLASRLTSFLKEKTGRRWIVSIVSSGGGQTIREGNVQKQVSLECNSMKNPTVRAIFENFPGSKFLSVTENTIKNDDFNVNDGKHVKITEWDPLEEE